MKRLFTYIITLSVLFFTSCVDKDFDLSDVNTDNSGVGDKETEITIPVATIEIDLEDILEELTRAKKSYTFKDQDIEDTIELGDNWLKEEFKSALTANGGKISLSLECSEYPEGLPAATAEIWFGDIALFDKAQTISAQNHKVTTAKLDDQTIDEISKSSSLNYKIHFAEKSFECDFDGAENIEFKLSMTKTGAIKL